MNLSQQQSDKNKIALALLYPPSPIEVNLVPLVTIGTDGEITVIYSVTEPQNTWLTYKTVFDKGLITIYALTVWHQNGQALYKASVYRCQAGKLTGVV